MNVKSIALTLLCFLLIGSGIFAYKIIQINVEVNKECSVNKEDDPGIHYGEAWAECAATVAQEKNDAEYCWAGGLFSPFTGLCIGIFADRADEKSDCETIFKPKQKAQCHKRFR